MDVLLNWLTQGTVVAILTAAALRLIPRSRAQARYGVLWTAYLLVLALPIAPIVLTMALGDATVDLVPTAASPVVTVPVTWWTSLPAAVGLWIVWAGVQSVRLVVSALGVRRARRRGRECPATILARLPYWSRVGASRRPARVILSDDVRAAAVLGCGRPVIALAPALIEELDTTDLDRVLVHEWAHVQRHDDVAQLAQRIVGIVIGWHPAAWWLQRQLEFEREAACDEIAVSVTGSVKGYATCLTMLAARPDSRLRSVGALAAASSSGLRARIMRILASRADTAARPWRAITVGASSGLLACTLVVADLQLVACTVTSAVASTATYLPRAAAAVRHQAVASGSSKRTKPDPSAAGRRTSGANRKPVEPPDSSRVAETEPVGESQPTAGVFAPLHVSASPAELTTSLIATTAVPEPPVHAADERSTSSPSASPEPPSSDQPRSPWTRVADVGVDLGRASSTAGVNVGRASQTAGTATAGFFKRFAKKVAGSF